MLPRWGFATSGVVATTHHSSKPKWMLSLRPSYELFKCGALYPLYNVLLLQLPEYLRKKLPQLPYSNSTSPSFVNTINCLQAGLSQFASAIKKFSIRSILMTSLLNVSVLNTLPLSENVEFRQHCIIHDALQFLCMQCALVDVDEVSFLSKVLSMQKVNNPFYERRFININNGKYTCRN